MNNYYNSRDIGKKPLTINRNRHIMEHVIKKVTNKLKHFKEIEMKNTTKTNTSKNKIFSLKTVAWFGMLLVVGSIAFSSYIVYFGTTDMIAKIMLVPQIAFAAGVAVYKFVK